MFRVRNRVRNKVRVRIRRIGIRRNGAEPGILPLPCKMMMLMFMSLWCSMLRFGFGSSPLAASSSTTESGAGAAAGSRRAEDKYLKMLRRELEGDSVDTDILDEELRFLREAEPKT